MRGILGILTVSLALPASGQEGEYRDLKASEVVEWMTREAKKSLVYGEELGLRNKRLQVPADALDPKRAYEVGVRLLKSADLAVVPGDRASGVIEIVPAPIASKKALAVHTSPDTLPQADEFCALSIRTKHASPRDLQAALINLVSYPQNCLSVESSGLLVLSDYASNLRKLWALVEQMDVPRASSAHRIAVTALVGTSDGEEQVPKAFRELDLPTAVGRNRFTTLGEVFTRLDTAAPPAVRVAGQPAGGGTDASMRLSGSLPLLVEFSASIRTGGGVALDRFTVRLDREQTQVGPKLLETRLEIREDKWLLVGAVPGEKEGTTIVVLVRATPER